MNELQLSVEKFKIFPTARRCRSVNVNETKRVFALFLCFFMLSERHSEFEQARIALFVTNFFSLIILTLFFGPTIIYFLRAIRTVKEGLVKLPSDIKTVKLRIRLYKRQTHKKLDTAVTSIFCRKSFCCNAAVNVRKGVKYIFRQKNTDYGQNYSLRTN